MSFINKTLSKRSSMWESTFTLPNYTRPQGGPLSEPGQQVQKTTEDLKKVTNQILNDEYAGLSLSSVELDECLEYIAKMVSQGYGLSYNRLKRLIGLWLVTQRNTPQTQYDEGYRELSFN